jgi:four helix bundle protein
MSAKLAHRNWPVYLDALAFHDQVRIFLKSVPKGYADLVDQIQRASNSIVLNISEGAGKFTTLDKRKFYLTASGSAHECSGVIDLFKNAEVLTGEEHARMIDLLEKICGGLLGLTTSLTR